jgi:ADP-ribose pyrophosphatase YjhB (NUDIX family)
MRIQAELYAEILAAMPIPCVDLLVTDALARVLLVERVDAPARGAWWFPGGRVHRDETRATAAIRKLREECGLEAVSSHALATYDLILPEAHAVTTVFHLVVANTAVRLDSHSGRYAWKTRSEWLQQPQHEFVTTVLGAR